MKQRSYNLLLSDDIVGQEVHWGTHQLAHWCFEPNILQPMLPFAGKIKRRSCAGLIIYQQCKSTLFLIGFLSSHSLWSLLRHFHHRSTNCPNKREQQSCCPQSSTLLCLGCFTLELTVLQMIG